MSISTSPQPAPAEARERWICLPRPWRGLTRLQILWLDKIHVTDAGLTHLTALPNLRDVGLTDTRVTLDGIDSLNTALPMVRVLR